MKIVLIIAILMLLLIGFYSLKNWLDTDIPWQTFEKPVLYLYPEEERDVTVKVICDGKIITSYPKYNHGWHVIVQPDGSMINKEDNNTYYYLFWEANLNTDFDMYKGFIVKGRDTEKFLREKLSYMGLTPKEYNDFIVYWLPRMEINNYNLISFQNEDYTDRVKLDINPKPDSVLRIMMVYQKLNVPIDIEEQQLNTFERKGFTVVEWGGMELK